MACHCRKCIRDRNERDACGFSIEHTRMIVCKTCGNKRCPHANDHRFACTDSNEIGQEGSAYA